MSKTRLLFLLSASHYKKADSLPEDLVNNPQLKLILNLFNFKHKEENKDLFLSVQQVDPALWNRHSAKKEMTSAMRLWDVLEESLYLSWLAFHSGKKIDDFYAEQKATAAVLSGTVESYGFDVKEKPGDFILKTGESPTAFLYSTHVDLTQYTGKQITFLVSPRPNNHFAFPAYYVLSVESQ
mgnify:CR=1 FL=1